MKASKMSKFTNYNILDFRQSWKLQLKKPAKQIFLQKDNINQYFIFYYERAKFDAKFFILQSKN